MPRNKSGHSRLTAENEYGADGVLSAPDLSQPKKYFTKSAEK